MLNLRNTWRPAVYHGHHKQRRFFEGWYFKLVDASGDNRYAIIPGIFLHDDPAESHAFIQTLDGVDGSSTYHRYPLAEFKAAKTEFDLHIGPNHFRADSLSLDIASPERQIKGKLRFDKVTPWPVEPLSPGVMGWYSFAPFMECYHGVLSFDHQIEGNLNIDGQPVDFSGGRGYIEKDWGKAFPRGYIWMQSNHFEMPGTCLTGSIAMIPWLWYEFRGYIVGLWHQGELYRFTTYTGADTDKLILTDTHVHWELSGKAGSGAKRDLYRLEIDAERASGGLLHAPYRTAMQERIVESLTANINVRLIRQSDRKSLFESVGRYGGLEVAGELEKLLDN